MGSPSVGVAADHRIGVVEVLSVSQRQFYVFREYLTGPTPQAGAQGKGAVMNEAVVAFGSARHAFRRTRPIQRKNLAVVILVAKIGLLLQCQVLFHSVAALVNRAVGVHVTGFLRAVQVASAAKRGARWETCAGHCNQLYGFSTSWALRWKCLRLSLRRTAGGMDQPPWYRRMIAASFSAL